MVLVPLLLLGGLEAALRVAHYGYDTGFFKKCRVGQQEFLVDNEKFSLRFFPPQLGRWPTPIMMRAHKPADTYRIFIMGESAAQGDPEPAYSAGRYLEELLRERFPGQKIEVINVAITAINSHVILPIARDCARHQGDLWILYMGNNEMVGPFGGASVFGAKAPPLWAVRLSLVVQRTRVSQWVNSLIRQFRENNEASSWGGMKMFLGNQLQPDDPRREVVYRNFQKNLQDILEAGRGSGARIILNTVAVNLKDCPPFASQSNSNLPAADRVACDRFYADACRAEGQGKLAEAAQYFEQAARLDPRMSDFQFHWGGCLLQLTNFASAREHFERACDDDALPFRADSRINAIIRQAGRDRSGPGLAFFDAAVALETNNPAGICGEELFYEHVHFNFDGNYRLGRAWAGQVEHLLPAGIASPAGSNWASQETCERRLGLTDWNRGLVTQSVIERLRVPPLSSQSNNGRRLQAFEDRANRLNRRADAAAAVKAREVYLEAIERAPGDHFLHESFAEFLQVIGDLEQATAQWRRVHELLPQDCLADYQLGHVLAQQRKWTEAQPSLLEAVTLRPSFPEAWYELGGARFAEGKYEMALQTYDRARQLRPNDPRIYFDTARALSLLKRSVESIDNFQHAISLKPDYWQAHYALGGELGMHDRIPEARSEFEEVLRLQPDYAMAHLNLGVALMKLARWDDARRQFEETLRLEPGNKLAQNYLGQVGARTKDRP